MGVIKSFERLSEFQRPMRISKNCIHFMPANLTIFEEGSSGDLFVKDLNNSPRQMGFSCCNRSGVRVTVINLSLRMVRDDVVRLE
jgi:hypothetical protein